MQITRKEEDRREQMRGGEYRYEARSTERVIQNTCRVRGCKKGALASPESSAFRNSAFHVSTKFELLNMK